MKQHKGKSKIISIDVIEGRILEKFPIPNLQFIFNHIGNVLLLQSLNVSGVDISSKGFLNAYLIRLKYAEWVHHQVEDFINAYAIDIKCQNDLCFILYFIYIVRENWHEPSDYKDYKLSNKAIKDIQKVLKEIHSKINSGKRFNLRRIKIETDTKTIVIKDSITLIKLVHLLKDLKIEPFEKLFNKHKKEFTHDVSVIAWTISNYFNQFTQYKTTSKLSNSHCKLVVVFMEMTGILDKWLESPMDETILNSNSPINNIRFKIREASKLYD